MAKRYNASMSEPLAFLLTWTTYGSWLPGDERGSVDAEHRMPGTPPAPPEERRVEINRHRRRSAPIVFSSDERTVVDRIVRRHCDIRQWWLGACNVRTNHVHCVVGATDIRPEAIVQQLKSWATRALREHDPRRFNGNVWTRYASTRYLWTKDDVESAVRYVVEGQDCESRWGPTPVR